MISVLAFIKSVAEFKKEHNDDFAIVYNYIWGEKDIYSYINYGSGQGLLDNTIETKSDVNSEILKHTEINLEKKYEGIAEWFNY